MALLFLDSFDHYASDDTTYFQGVRKWTTFPNGVGTVPGRTGQGIQVFGVSVPTKVLNNDSYQLTAGVAQNFDGFGNQILQFSNAAGGPWVGLNHVGDGRLNIAMQYYYENVSSPPSTFVCALNTWYYFEFKVSQSGGSLSTTLDCTVRVNEEVILTFTYSYSHPIYSQGFNAVTIGGPGGGNHAIADDFYLTDGEFLGDIRIGVLYPNAVGDSADWTANPAGVSNWMNVDETPADDDTTYNSAGAVGLKDLYNMQNIDPGFIGTIKGVQALWLVKKSDTGAASVKGVWKSAGTEIIPEDGYNYVPPNGFPPSFNSYTYTHDAKRISLFTSTDWTVSEINGLQLGIIRTE